MRIARIALSRKALITAGIAAVVVGGPIAAMAGTTGDTYYSGCVTGSNRALQHVHTNSPTSCPRGSFEIEWNKVGRQGPQGPAGATGQQGAQGPAGKDGKDALAGAIWRTENYPAGIGPGGVATVACADDDATSQQYVAISGGVQVNPGDNMGQLSQSLPIAASFPGRMDWSTNTPKTGRLDGWIIQTEVGYNANDTSARLWALCVPVANAGGSVPIQPGA